MFGSIIDRLKLRGGTDGTVIGNRGDRLSVNASQMPEIDSGNSTDIALTAGSIFYGPWTQREHPEILMSGYSDQNFTWYAQFATTELSQTPATPVYTGGPAAGIDSSIPYTYTAGSIEVPARLQVAREWYRIVIVNTSGSNMGTLRFQTSIGKFDALTQSVGGTIQPDLDAIVVKSILSGLSPSGDFQNVAVDENGSLDVESPSQTFGNKANSANRDLFGSLYTTQRVFTNQVQFSNGLNADSLIITTNATGTVTNSNGRNILATGTDAAGSALFDSLDTLGYKVGSEHYCTAAVRFPTVGTQAGDEIIIGMFDSNRQNGWGVGYQGTTFGVFQRNGGTDEFVSAFSDDALDGNSASTFRRDNVPEALNPQNFNVFRITYSWHGASVVKFEIAGPDGNWVLFHQFKNPNNNTAPSIETPLLSFHAEANKTSGSQDLKLEITAFSFGFFGLPNSETSAGNSTTTQLAIGETFTGRAFETLQFSEINVSWTSDVNSAAGGMEFQFSGDGVNWFTTNSFTMDPAVEAIRIEKVGISGRFFRVRYTNGGTATTQFQIQTIKLLTITKDRIYRLGDTVNLDNGATLSKAVLTGLDADTGTFKKVGVAENDRLKVQISGFEIEDNLPVTLPEYEDFLYRLRTTQPVQLFQGQWGFNGQPLVWSSDFTGGATLDEPATTGHNFIKFNTTTASGDMAIYQTKRYFRYQPSRTHTVTFAAGFGAPKTNVVKRMGQFDDSATEGSNGFYVEQDGTGFSFVIASTASGSQTYNKISRANWNGDKLDGTGPSGLNLTDEELGKVVIWNLDYSWYGASGVQFNIINGPTRIVCHEEIYSFVNADFPFTKTAFLPLRIELENTGTVAAGGGEFTIGSISYDIENGETREAGFQWSKSTGTSQKSISNSGTIVMAIRPKATINGIENRGVILPNSISIATTADAWVEVLVGGQATGGSWTSVDTDSIAEYNTNASGYTGGRVINETFITSGGGNASGSLISSFPGDLFVSIDSLLNTQDAVAVRMTRIGSSTQARAAIGWREIY